jgi:hypothetical protein
MITRVAHTLTKYICTETPRTTGDQPTGLVETGAVYDFYVQSDFLTSLSPILSKRDPKMM